MYITINNIKGEKRIDLSYSIQSFDSGKEIAVIRMLSDNVKYEILKLCVCSNESYFKHEKDDSKWNLCRQRITLHARRDH